MYSMYTVQYRKSRVQPPQAAGPFRGPRPRQDPQPQHRGPEARCQQCSQVPSVHYTLIIVYCTLYNDSYRMYSVHSQQCFQVHNRLACTECELITVHKYNCTQIYNLLLKLATFF